MNLASYICPSIVRAMFYLQTVDVNHKIFDFVNPTFTAMQSLVEHIALSDNRVVIGWAAIIIANMSQCSLARNILKHNDGIRKLVGNKA